MIKFIYLFKTLLLCVFITPLLLHSQQIKSGKIEYVAFINNSIISNKLENDQTTGISSKEFVKKNFKNSSEYRFIVDFNSNFSISRGVQNLDNDKNKYGGGFGKILLKTNDIVYTKLNSDSTFVQKASYGNALVLMKPFNWTLYDETKLINNRVCYKATTTRSVENSSGKQEVKIIAWYSKEIPLPIGPTFYNGLPGLIIELTTNNGIVTFKADKITLKGNDKVKIKLPSKPIISEEEAIRISKNNYKTLIGN